MKIIYKIRNKTILLLISLLSKKIYNKDYSIIGIAIPVIRDFLDSHENWSNHWKSRELAEKLFDQGFIKNENLDN